MSGSEIFAVLLASIWAVVYVRARRGIRLTPVVQPGKTPAEPTHAFVPARNEAEVIEACVRALGTQDGLARLTVVDDQSSDETPKILARLQAELPVLSVVAGRGPPPGTCGKPAALEAATLATPPSAEWLLFLDADVVLDPGALSGLFELQRQTSADLVSVLPRLELPSLLEEIVMPAVAGIITARHRPEWVNDPEHDAAFANGQLILLRRSVYEAIGGHASVRSEVLEDVRLAERVKAAGHRLLIADGRHVARTRMYASFAEMVEGWSKNLFLLVGSKVSAALAWTLLVLALGLAPLLALFLGGVPIGIAAYLVILAGQIQLRRLGGVRAPVALLAPVGAVLAAYLVLRSTWLHRGRRRVEWKGRGYGDEA